VASGPAVSADDVRRQAAAARTLDELAADSTTCRACPRLVAWREEVARVKRRSFADEPYWGRPVPGWGDEQARIAIIGLAPAAHGGNRTGRVFTGDRSGDWLFAALHRAGLAAKPTSVRADDGQQLFGVRMVAAVRCAPPANKPTIDERDTCRPWLVRELELLAPTLKVLVVLGGFGWQALLPNLAAAGYALPRPLPRFGHGVRVDLSDADGRVSSATAERRTLSVLGCYHPSQQNTFTGKLTESMLDDVLELAKTVAQIGS
jgi:uracil-DNA glycosylase